MKVGEIKWQKFKVTDIFDLHRGDFHSIANLDPGPYLTISRIATDNGLVGLYNKPDGAKIWPAGVITVSTVTGDAFLGRQSIEIVSRALPPFCVKIRLWITN